MQTVLVWLSATSLLLGASFTIALLRGDRIRRTYSYEEPSDQALRLKVGTLCLAVGITSGLLALAIE